MKSWIALLRGVNVGGHRKAPAAELRVLLAEMGFAEPRSLLASGNLVFGAEGTTAGELERRLEAAFSERMGLDTDVMVRSPEDWTAAIAANPFRVEAEREPSRAFVMALKSAPAAAEIAALKASIAGWPEQVEVVGREAFLVYPNGAGTSKLTNALIDRKLGTRGTARNWNTTRKLRAMVAPSG
ncbi:DUF1697 domain-containing protein [Caulobacter sp. 17J80-11]|uniref:DUF1697 domain-containing protein n=1 Tax=Caulobacter sp. 17J80-11 TaxID=2763502 RepID=UPI0016535A41|nr:DUF1697 domain-containing protein [Caulobacter sp. 17J80-11]